MAPAQASAQTYSHTQLAQVLGAVIPNTHERDQRTSSKVDGNLKSFSLPTRLLQPPSPQLCTQPPKAAYSRAKGGMKNQILALVSYHTVPWILNLPLGETMQIYHRKPTPYPTHQVSNNKADLDGSLLRSSHPVSVPNLGLVFFSVRSTLSVPGKRVSISQTVT